MWGLNVDCCMEDMKNINLFNEECCFVYVSFVFDVILLSVIVDVIEVGKF